MKSIYILFWMLTSVVYPLKSQDLSGYWQGVEYAPGSSGIGSWPTSLTLNQNGNLLTGECLEVNVARPQIFVLWNIVKGSVQNNKGFFELKDIKKDNPPPGGYWCVGTINFTYYPDEEKIIGIAAYTNCGSTTFELYRIALKTPNKFCKDQSVNLLVTGKNVKWYTDEGKKNLVNVGSTFSPKLTQTTTFYVTQTHYNTESPVVPIKIEINEAAILTTAVTEATCGKNNGAISVTAKGASPIQYSLNNGLAQNTAVFVDLSPETYTISIQDAAGCRATKQVILPKVDRPAISVTTQNGTCTGGNDGSITVNAISGRAPYQYSLDSTSYQVDNLFKVAPRSYTVYVKDATNCVVRVSTTVGTTNDIQLHTLQDTAVCKGRSIKLLTSSNATNFSWFPSTGLDNARFKEPQATPTHRTEYIVTASYGACSKTDTVIVNLSPGPPPPIAQDRALCAGEVMEPLSAVGSAIQWYSDSTLTTPIGTGNSFKPDVTTKQPGIWHYYLTQTLADGCLSVPTQVRLEIKEAPTLALPLKMYTGCFSVDPKDILTLDAGLNTAISYSWSQADGVYLGASRQLDVNQPGLYIIRVTNAYLCTTQDTIAVKELCAPALFAPDAFSPNGDGENDLFTFKGRFLDTVRLTIYSRWGEVIYRSDKAEWDGTSKGLSCLKGTYEWQIELFETGIPQPRLIKTGSVVLIK